MAVPAQRSRWWASRRVPLLGALLAVAMLVPVGALFVEHLRHLGSAKSSATLERQGVEYVSALNRVAVALTDAQSAAVSDRPLPHDGLARAIEATDEVDGRLGEQLRVQERWSQLRDRVGQLSGTEYADPRTAYDDYGEATDLLLDLYNKLRETSGMIRDADPDAYYLQDAAAEELPEAMVAAGRLADLVVIASTASADGQAPDNAEISVARVAVSSPSTDLAADLQAALESTASRTLSSNVLSQLDQFLAEKDALLAAVRPDGRVAEVEPVRVTVVREQLQVAAAELLGALLTEMDSLVAARVDQLTGSQLTAIGAAVAAVLLTAGLLWVILFDARWPGRGHGRDTADSGAGGSGAGGEPGDDGAVPAEGAAVALTREPARAR